MNLIEQCKQAIERDILKDGKPRITVVLKGKWTKSGKKKLFNLPQAPKGNIFADHSGGKLVVSFDAKEVLAYCEQLVTVLLSIEEQRQVKGIENESN